MKGLDAKFREGNIISIRRLFIYEQKEELEDFRTRLCFLLHAQSNYEYKIISKKDFDSILLSFGDRTLVNDFGIYGEHFIWETAIENKVFIDSGYVNVDKKRIAKYTELYKRIWTVASKYEILDNELITKYKNFRMVDFRTISCSNSSENS